VKRQRIVVAGYFVRCPLGGYAWQVLHYLAGFRALGHEVFFYEGTEYDPTAYDPVHQEVGPIYENGVAAAERFFRMQGFHEDWAFRDVHTGRAWGGGAARLDRVFQRADVLINLGGVNRFGEALRRGRLTVYVDLDPIWTQLYVDRNPVYLAFLHEHDAFFTLGEALAGSDSPVPSGGIVWRPTRPPVATALWEDPPPLRPSAAFTTIGKFHETNRDVVLDGKRLSWSKRPEWLALADLPRRTGARFLLATSPDDEARRHMEAGGWEFIDPDFVSADIERYRGFIRDSAGELTVAKGMNIRLASGWFSDRSVCYLASGRPVTMQDTGFGRFIPTGEGLFAFRTLDEAAAAVEACVTDPNRHGRHAAELAREQFEAAKVCASLLDP
jgi:hypothetical protein